ncbi:phenol hydroxylase subunit [Sphingomonas sp. C3-2]|uniref:phenol hydroxylase subunit n=1 Tax=Sphingomonas sp. C3-2 TaxID=3062169 RepID=UPI00294B8DBC|nr:phenol hydroxylase subunit [Sphingomonas sp. C3-2]WOK35817.1 phenol hydroxylase subunit [Sphingomonas sp. C3-2]
MHEAQSGTVRRLAPPAREIYRRVRVTGIRRARYVEFDYVHGDPDLAVELVMPLAAFDTFCTEQHCAIAAASPEARAALSRLDHPLHPRSSRFASIAIWESPE